MLSPCKNIIGHSGNCSSHSQVGKLHLCQAKNGSSKLAYSPSKGNSKADWLKQKVKRIWEAILACLKSIFCCKKSDRLAPKEQATPVKKNDDILRDKPPSTGKFETPYVPSLERSNHVLSVQEKSRLARKKEIDCSVPILKNIDRQVVRPAFTDKFIPSDVWGYKIFPFLDPKSLQALKIVSRSFNDLATRYQNAICIPDQLDQVTKENKERLRHIETVCVSLENLDKTKILVQKIKEGLLPKLKKIEIEQRNPVAYERGERTTVQDKAIASLVEALPELEEVQLISNKPSWEKYRGSSLLLGALAAHCPKLRVLDLHWNLDISSMTLVERERSRALVQELTKGWPNLETLYFTDYWGHFEEEWLNIIVTNCPKLRRIDLSGNLLFDSAVELIAKNCPDLESLKLKCVKPLRDSFVELGKGCPRLTEFAYWNDARYWRNDLSDLKLLIESCPTIERLDLSYTNMSESGPRLLNLLKLKCLKLFGIYDLNGQHVNELLNGQPHLQELYLYNAISGKIHLKEPHRLRTFFLGFNGNLDDLLSLPSQLPFLENLSLSTNILTDEFLQEISRHCPRLKTLSIQKSDSIFTQSKIDVSQKAIQALQAVNKKLKISINDKQYFS